MKVNFDLVIKTVKNTVDMKSALQTMQGVSDTLRSIAETISNGVVPQRKTLNDDMRTQLEQSFIGSYGQNFSIEACSERAQKKLEEIGEEVFVEIINYYISDALFQDYPKLSESANKVVEDLGRNSVKLIHNLRNGTLQRAHTISNNFDYDVVIRYKKDLSEEPEVIQNLSQETYGILVPKKDSKTIILFIAVTRFNIFTGNGRCTLQYEESEQTVAFGFISYKYLNQKRKKIFSENLNNNNGLHEDESMEYIKVKARALRKLDGGVVKYIIEEVVDD